MGERLVVIGGDAAGMSAASQARRLKGPDDLAIVAFERGNYTSFSACGIPYFVGGVVDEIDRLVVRTPQAFKDKYAIDARVRHCVTEIDLDKRAVKVHDLDGGGEWSEGFDKLMIATGAQPIRPPLPGVDASHVFGVQVLDHGIAIKHALDEEKPERAVVVGGGYIGLEMAEALTRRGITVSLVEAAPQPMTTLDPDMGTLVADAMRDMDISVHTGEPVVGFEETDGRVSAVVTQQRTLPTDIVVLGLGVRPNTELAADAGISIGPTTAVATDEYMQTDADDVWSAGDCAEKSHRVSRRPVAIALGTHANKEGRVAGINIGGGRATFPGVLGTAVAKICELEVARTGLNEKEARDAGLATLSATVDSTTRAGYYPGAAPIKTKFVVEEGTGRLLGAQVVGREGAAKRIDVLAAVIWNEMTVDEILNLDLGYAPPFSPVWDPVLVAARKAWQLVEQSSG